MKSVTWTNRINEPHNKEWACELDGKLIGKVRQSYFTGGNFVGEVYINGTTKVVYRDKDELLARGHVARFA